MGTTTALLLAAQAIVIRENSPGVRFYCFPVDPEICREWIRRVNRTGFAVTANSRLCSNHFSGKKKFSPLHLPTIFSHQTYAKEYARAPPRKRVSVDDPTNTFHVFGLCFEVRFAGVVGVRTFNNRVLRLPAIVLLNTTFRPGNSSLLRVYVQANRSFYNFLLLC